MTPSLRDAREAGLEVPRSSAGPAPGIEVGAPEVELAPGPSCSDGIARSAASFLSVSRWTPR